MDFLNLFKWNCEKAAICDGSWPATMEAEGNVAVYYQEISGEDTEDLASDAVRSSNSAIITCSYDLYVFNRTNKANSNSIPVSNH